MIPLINVVPLLNRCSFIGSIRRRHNCYVLFNDINFLIPERRAKNSGNKEARYPMQMMSNLHDESREQLIVGRN